MRHAIVIEPVSEVLKQCARIRDTTVAARNTSSGGGLIKETHAVLAFIGNSVGIADVRQAVLKGSVFHKPSFASRKRILSAIDHRYLNTASECVVQSLVKAARHGVHSVEFISLAYLYFALRDRLICEFVTGPVWDRWLRKTTALTPNDFLSFLQERSPDYPEIKQWREATKKKLASNALSSLRDFGLLRGVKNKQIQRPAVSPEAVFHLLCILVAEGRESASIIEAPDWRLFLFTEPEIARALSDLAQKNWIRFEKSGRAVSLELIRMPEVGK
jgi:hypothetical protein